MTKDEALGLALEALLWANNEINELRDDAYGYKPEDQPQIMKAITAIKQARSAPVQEPVAWVTGFYAGRCVIKTINPAAILPVGVALYTTPPAAQRQWVGLTDEEMDELVNRFARYELVRATENLLRSKSA